MTRALVSCAENPPERARPPAGAHAMNVFRALPLLALALLAAGCPGKPKTSVLLITVDTLRADHLGCYGYERPTSPALDALAAESVLFERAYAQAPFTAPSHASLFTSLHTPSHGVTYWGHALAPEARTYAERFGERGWRTGAFYNHPTMKSCDLERGFEHVEVRYFEPAEDTIAAFAKWAESSDEPFAAWIHLWDVHRPYAFRSWKGEPYESGELAGKVARAGTEFAFEETRFGEPADVRIGRREEFYNVRPDRRAAPFDVGGRARVLDGRDWQHVEDRYDGGVWYADRALGHLFEELKRLGLYDTTLIAVTADHGETLTEREPCWFTHDPYLYEEVLRVPLVMRFPGARHAGMRVGTLARGIDVLPTLLEVADLSADAIQGRSLMPAVRGESAGTPTYLFAQTQTRSAKESARRIGADEKGWLETREVLSDGRYKLIADLETGKASLFDLSADPGETRDAAGDPALAGELARLEKALAALRTLPKAGATDAHLTPEQRALLQSAGYLGENEPPPGE